MRRVLFLFPVLAMFVGGCASFSGTPRPILVPDEEITTLKPLFDTPLVLAYYEAAPDSEERQNLRNQIVAMRLHAIDVRFGEYTQDLAKELRGGAFSMDVLSIALTGIATVTNSASAASALAGADTALKGGRQAFNKQVLVENTLPVLITQMQSKRKRIGTEIWYSLANRTDAEYPLPLALTQLQDYYEAGTIAGALTSLTQTASIESAAASDEFRSEVLQLNFGTNTYTEMLNKYVESASTPEEMDARIREIDAIIESSNLPNKLGAIDLLNTSEPEFLPLQKFVVDSLTSTGKLKPKGE